MVVVRLQGGLGNQMFQYAAARGARKGKVFFDLSFFKLYNSDNDQFTPRSFELDIFANLNGRELREWQYSLFNSKNNLARILRRLWYGSVSLIKQDDSAGVVFPKTKTLVLQGFFQSEKYFSAIRKELMAEFRFPEVDPKNQILAHRIISEQNPVSVHVRRGDYLKPKIKDYHGVLSLEYYVEAIRFIKDQTQSAFFILFSDDPDWCEQNLSQYLDNFIVVKGNDGSYTWKDMYLMTLCKNHIIANSTFSWWGAWLSTHDGKKIIAPKTWFLDQEMNGKTKQLIPESWIRM